MASHPIAQIRDKLDLSQSQLAMLAGVWPGHLSQVENGIRNPNTRLLDTLQELGYDPDELRQSHVDFAEAQRNIELQRLRERVA